MEKELINDPRLTPTMERVRSGRTQMFRERNPEDRTFIREDNCDVSLEHEKKSKYAELIDGQWYWVEGCAECKGEPRDWMTYVECDDHDRCRVCETKRKDLNGKNGKTVWGGKHGWICSSCEEERRAELKREAFEKFNSEYHDEYDFYSNDDPLCPHCGSKMNGDDIYEDEETECGICDGKVSIEVHHTRTFTTKIKGKRITG